METVDAIWKACNWAMLFAFWLIGSGMYFYGLYRATFRERDKPWQAWKLVLLGWCVSGVAIEKRNRDFPKPAPVVSPDLSTPTRP